MTEKILSGLHTLKSKNLYDFSEMHNTEYIQFHVGEYDDDGQLSRVWDAVVLWDKLAEWLNDQGYIEEQKIGGDQ